MERRLTIAHISLFYQYLKEDEREPSTIQKYLQDVKFFAAWLGNQSVTKDAVIRWKEHLQKAGRADIALKGKIRTILLPRKLCRKLIKYAQKKKITSGELFLTRSGKGLSRRQIWAEMKAICQKAGVAASKVFPHNLRHLFARSFYRAYRDVVKLADVLGHSSIGTTRIYLVSTGTKHAQQMARLGLII